MVRMVLRLALVIRRDIETSETSHQAGCSAGYEDQSRLTGKSIGHYQASPHRRTYPDSCYSAYTLPRVPSSGKHQHVIVLPGSVGTVLTSFFD